MAFEYIVNGKVVKLPVDRTKVGVRFRESLSKMNRKSVIDEKPEVGAFKDRLEVPNETITIVDVAQSALPGPAAAASAFDALTTDPGVEQVLPVFDLGNQKKAVATDRIIVAFKPDNEEKKQEILDQIGGEVVGSKANEFVIRLEPGHDPFDAVAEAIKRPEVDFAEPDFITIGRHTTQRNTPDTPDGGSSNGHPADDVGDFDSILNAPDESDIVAAAASAGAESGVKIAGSSKAFAGLGVGVLTGGPDPLQKFQYAVRITHADEAWKRVSASPEIKIAILDEGVDVTHPDLQTAIRGTYDAIYRNSNQQPNSWDAHGTACAGLAAAVPNNSLGIRGIAGGCSMLGIRIALSAEPGADWTTSNSQISDGIDWAWQNGADILSNSWGGGAPSNAITNAFERARTQGRGGRGCVILVAAGNDSLPIVFPANLPNVMTVTASNEFDEPKTKTSADGETEWGSSFGAEADIAAPGVHNYTTDIVGAGGYNRGGTVHADYAPAFNGTSSSTPIAAGVAALVLSANPELKESTVRRILKETADKVGQVVYVNGRNDQMGHGRVNALRAVEAAPHAV